MSRSVLPLALLLLAATVMALAAPAAAMLGDDAATASPANATAPPRELDAPESSVVPDLFDDTHVVVHGRLVASYVQTPRFHVLANGFTHVKQNLVVYRTLHTRQLMTRALVAGEVNTRVLKGPSNRVAFSGRVQVQGSIAWKGPPKGMTEEDEVLESAPAFLEEYSIVSHVAEEGVDADAGADADVDAPSMRQWRHAVHDHFTHAGDTHRWQTVVTDATTGEPLVLAAAPAIEHCGSDAESEGFLALRRAAIDADAVASTRPTTELRLEKQFVALPVHTQLEVTARLHLVDAWRGDVAFAAVDGAYAWLESHGEPTDTAESAAGLVNLCGDAAWGGDRLSVPVKFIVPHTASTATIAFGVGTPSEGPAWSGVLGLSEVSLAFH